MLAGTRCHAQGIVRRLAAADDAPAISTSSPPPTIGLIGAPTDVGGSLRGACMGPDALRVAGLVQALQQHGLNVVDWGNLHGPINPMHPMHEGCRHLQKVVTWNHRVFDTVQTALAWGQQPVLLGGDHSLAIGSIAAVVRHCLHHGLRLLVVWLDAHADCNTPATSPTGHLHGMPLACLLGQGPDALTQLCGPAPLLHPLQLCMMGVRSTDPGEEAFLQVHGICPWRWQGGVASGWLLVQALKQLLAQADAKTHVHLSLDLDVLDPRRAPGVSTPEPGGLTPTQAMACMRALGRSGRVGSVELMELMELNPARDVRQKTARLAMALLTGLLVQSVKKPRAVRPS